MPNPRAETLVSIPDGETPMANPRVETLVPDPPLNNAVGKQRPVTCISQLEHSLSVRFALGLATIKKDSLSTCHFPTFLKVIFCKKKLNNPMFHDLQPVDLLFLFHYLILKSYVDRRIECFLSPLQYQKFRQTL